MTADNRRFLFLQGPHGPWFRRLGALLGAAGATVWRVGFNLGDRVFWPGPGYIAFDGPPDRWADTCASLFDLHRITDLVVYGDKRGIHAEAIALARARGITVHVSEEGYLRPYWITYERCGRTGIRSRSGHRGPGSVRSGSRRSIATATTASCDGNKHQCTDSDCSAIAHATRQ